METRCSFQLRTALFTLGSRATLARALAFALTLIGLAATKPAEAQSDPDDLARRHFESGAAYFEQADYDAALREFQSAFHLSARPTILLNIATVYERLGQLDLAVKTLDNYLALKPNDDGSAVVRIRRDNLQKRLDANAAAAPPAANAAPPPDAAPASETPPHPAPQTTPKPLPEPTMVPAPSPRPEPEPSRVAPNRMPAYALLSIAGALGAGSIFTGVLAKSKYDDAKHDCAPHCSSSRVSSSKTLATLSTVLTGAAVVSATVGVVLWVEAGPSETARTAPAVGVEIADGGARAAARWRF